jgi:hypothetical protein
MFIQRYAYSALTASNDDANAAMMWLLDNPEPAPTPAPALSSGRGGTPGDSSRSPAPSGGFGVAAQQSLGGFSLGGEPKLHACLSIISLLLLDAERETTDSPAGVVDDEDADSDVDMLGGGDKSDGMLVLSSS